MRAARWTGEGGLAVVEAPMPELRPGWALVRVEACGICGSDLHFFRGAFAAAAGGQPGHEIAGVVEVAGQGVAIEPGTPVAVEPIIACGECRHCRTGVYNRCRSSHLIGIRAKGGLAEYVLAPAERLHPLPAGLPWALAALTEPVAVCVRGVRLGRVGLGARVAILGAGTIGQLCIPVARAAGASEILITARHPHQAAAARALGADATFADAESLARHAGPDGIDVVIETVGGHAGTIAEAISVVRAGGVVSVLGVFDTDVPLPALSFMSREVTLVGSNCYALAEGRPEFAIAVELIERHANALLSLVTHTYPLAAVNDAFATAADKSSGSIKVQVAPQT